MGKGYREIKFTYGGNTYSVDVKTEQESVITQDIFSIFTSLSGKRYMRKTGETTNYTYTFSYCIEELWDFFNDAYGQSTLVLSRELDDGSFEEIDVFVLQPIGEEETVDDTTDKIYRDVTIEVYSS